MHYNSDLVRSAVLLVVFLKTLQHSLQSLLLPPNFPFILKQNFLKILIPMTSSPMQIHFMIPSLKLTPLNQASKHIIFNHKLLLFFLIILHQFIQKLVFIELEWLKSTIWTFIINFFEMSITQDALTSVTSDSISNPFHTDYAVVLTLIMFPFWSYLSFHQLDALNSLSKLIILNSFLCHLIVIYGYKGIVQQSRGCHRYHQKQLSW